MPRFGLYRYSGVVRPHPAVGKYYANSTYRLMIVGESHYSSEKARLDVEFTKRVVEIHEHSRFYGALNRSLAKFLGVDSIWDEVIFCNYILQPFSAAREPVTERRRNAIRNKRAFFEILEKHKPRKVLVLGKLNWFWLAGGPDYAKLGKTEPIAENSFSLGERFTRGHSDKTAFWYKTGTRNWALLAAIYHPAYPSGFHSKESAQIIHQLLRKNWKAPM